MLGDLWVLNGVEAHEGEPERLDSHHGHPTAAPLSESSQRVGQ